MSERPQSVHWSELSPEEQIRYWQGVDDGSIDSFLVSPEKKQTRRRRGDHSTKPKCESPAWFRPAHYKALGGQLGCAYNRLVKKDKETGQISLRMHISRHPFYIKHREKAGRRYAFRPEKRRLLDALMPLAISFCDAGKHTTVICVSRLARELSPKDGRGKVIPEMEVTVSRLSRLINEQVLFGVFGVAEKTWDRESKSWLPKYIYITDTGFRILGVDMQKLHEQQQRKLKESEERRALIREGILGEDEELSVHAARKRWYEQKTLEALRYRRQQAAARKRANRLEKLPRDQQIEDISSWLLKTMPAEEAYYCSDERLQKLAIQHLYQLKLALEEPPPW